MKRAWIVTMLAAVWLGCGPVSNNDSSGSAEGSGGSSGGASSSTGTATNTSTTATSTETLGTSSAGTGDESTTGGGIPAACIAQGWDDSLATFTAMSEAANATYYYVRPTGGGGFKGPECNYETTIEGVAGVIVRRTFAIVGVPEGTTEQDCTEQPWVEEDEASVGSHNGMFVAPPYTMEQLYDGCCDLLALEPADEYVFSFGVDRTGVVQSCDALLANCADGCEVTAGGFASFYLQTFAFGMP